MRRVRDSLTARALRYRSGQAVALFLLSLLGVAACAFGPLYERSVEAAQLRSTLGFAPVPDRGLSVRAGATPTVDPLLPTGRVRSFYGPPTRSTTLNVMFDSRSGPIDGSIVNRDGQCAHLRIVAGACPSTPRGVVASTSSAEYLHLRVGSQVPVTTMGWNPNRGIEAEGSAGLTVVGLYAPFDSHDEYWFGHPYSTAAGVTVIGPEAVDGGQNTKLVADAFFARSSFPQDLASSLPARAKPLTFVSADLSLRVDRVGLDDLSTLRPAISALTARDARMSVGSTVDTQLPGLLDQVDHGRSQARTIIPVYAAELALLILVVVVLIVATGAEQRQPDLALARLRGNSAGRSARLFTRELGGLVLLSLVPGVVLAFALCAGACRWWLDGRAHAELRWPVVLAAAGAATVELAIVAWGGRRTASRPVVDLLRRIPARVSRRGIGMVEAMAVAAAVGGVAVLHSGAHDNPLAVLTPALIALVAGLLLSRLVGLVAGLAGRTALWRGRLATGLAGLQVARRSGIRRAVILLCVATALVVSAVDQWSVSSRNRSARAHVQAGAPVVLTTHASSAAALVGAVSAADPSGRYATAVIRQLPQTGPAVFAVDPAAFGRIAGWGWPTDRPSGALLASLDPPRPAPIRFAGTTLRLRLADVTLTRQTPSIAGGSRGPVFLVVDGIQTGGTEVATRIGPLPEGRGHAADLVAHLPCAAGCRLSQLSLSRTTSDADVLTIDARIAALLAGRPSALRPVELGRSDDWLPTTADSTDPDGHEQTIRMRSDGSSLHLHVVNSSGPAVLQQGYLPATLPAITAGVDAGAGGSLAGNNIDGIAVTYTPVGSTSFVPGAGGPALLVDRRLAMRTATPGLLGSNPEVWLGSDQPARERALTAALARHGVTVVGRVAAARYAAELAASAPAWSMQLALVAAALAVVIAALIVVLSASASRRIRAYDASTMALVGVDRATLRRVALTEFVVAALVAVLAGAVVGVFGARLALPAIPIFIQDAPVPDVLLPIAWVGVTVAAAATLLALGAVSAVAALAALHRLGPARLRNGPHT